MDQPSGTRKGIGADVMSGPGKVGSVYDGRGGWKEETDDECLSACV